MKNVDLANGKLILLILIIAVILISGCIVPPINPPTQKKGTSYEDAIVIGETAMDKGILKEYEYLEQYSCNGKGGFEKEPSQDLYEQNGHYYHLMQVVCKNGDKEEYYFMIDSFFGKIETLPPDDEIYKNGTVIETTSGKKGSSYEDAIVIEATTEMEGIPKEYEYLRNYGCPDKGGVKENLLQELQNYKGSYYDILHVRCNNGEEMDYYFLIDSFFGKM